MAIIEVLQPDDLHVYTTEQRSHAAIAEEVAYLFPEATHWRMSPDWRGIEDGKPVDQAASIRSMGRTIAVVLVLALILTPVISWLATLDGGIAPLFAWTAGAPAHTAEADEADAYPSPHLGNAAEDVHIAGIEQQASDTSMTLRVLLRNNSPHPYEQVGVRAMFYDQFGTEIPAQEGNVGTLSLGPEQEGYVKVWAHSDYGVAEYKLEIVDEIE